MHTKRSSRVLKAEARPPERGVESSRQGKSSPPTAQLERAQDRAHRPRAGARVGKRKLVTVAWRAADADNNRLHVELDYSSTAAVASGDLRRPEPGQDHAPQLALRRHATCLAPPARERRLQREQRSSKIFAAVGRPPAILITSPAPRQRVIADAQIYLEGSAYDDNGRLLRGSACSGSRAAGGWTGLAAQRHRARPRSAADSTRRHRRTGSPGNGFRAHPDPRGRASSARGLRTDPPEPTGETARPAAVGDRSGEPASSRKRFHLGRTPRRIVLPVRAGKKPLRVLLRLVARGGTSRVLLVIRRG